MSGLHLIHLVQKNNPLKKKFYGSYFNCGKRSHKATECQGPKKKKDQANYNDLFSRFEQHILFLEKQAETTEPTTDRRGVSFQNT